MYIGMFLAFDVEIIDVYVLLLVGLEFLSMIEKFKLT